MTKRGEKKRTWNKSNMTHSIAKIYPIQNVGKPLICKIFYLCNKKNVFEKTRLCAK